MKIKNVIILASLLACLSMTALAAVDSQKAVPAQMPGVTVDDLKVIPQVAALKEVYIGGGTTILGTAEVSKDQMVRFITANNPHPKLNCTVEELVNYYYEEGTAEGVRPDIALCQALLETGFFAYGGDVIPEQNNYCGLGTTGTIGGGCYFLTPRQGARAHIQHLLGYTSTRLPQKVLVDPRYYILKEKYPQYYGHIPYWTGLNGKWALPGKGYGETILRYWLAAKKM